MKFNFTYRQAGTLKEITKNFPNIGEAIDGFWEIPEISDLKTKPDHISLVSIKKVTE